MVVSRCLSKVQEERLCTEPLSPTIAFFYFFFHFVNIFFQRSLECITPHQNWGVPQNRW